MPFQGHPNSLQGSGFKDRENSLLAYLTFAIPFVEVSQGPKQPWGTVPRLALSRLSFCSLTLHTVATSTSPHQVEGLPPQFARFVLSPSRKCTHLLISSTANAKPSLLAESNGGEIICPSSVTSAHPMEGDCVCGPRRHQQSVLPII